MSDNQQGRGGMATTGREARIAEARKLRKLGMEAPIFGNVATCGFCGATRAAKVMRRGSAGLIECRAVAACEKRMRQRP